MAFPSGRQLAPSIEIHRILNGACIWSRYGEQVQSALKTAGAPPSWSGSAFHMALTSGEECRRGSLVATASLKNLSKPSPFRSVVVERSHVTVPRDTFDVEADGPGESVEPLVAKRGRPQREPSRYLVEYAIEGTAFAANDLGRVEVPFDHRRVYNQAMLVRGGLLRHCPEFCVLNTALIRVLLHVEPFEHASAIVALAQEQLDRHSQSGSRQTPQAVSGHATA
jgi:hypothetical protein